MASNNNGDLTRFVVGFEQDQPLVTKWSLAAALALAPLANGQSSTQSPVVSSVRAAGGDFILTKVTIDSGGGIAAGGKFVLTGSIGQSDAGTTSGNGSFIVSGGFWTATINAGPREEHLFADGFE